MRAGMIIYFIWPKEICPKTTVFRWLCILVHVLVIGHSTFFGCKFHRRVLSSAAHLPCLLIVCEHIIVCEHQLLTYLAYL